MNQHIIKFRGKRVDNGQWVYGVPLFVDMEEENPEDSVHVACIVTGCEWNGAQGFVSPSNEAFVEVIPKTIGQFIGKLKTGDEIYINDLIKHGETVRIVEYRNGNTSLIRQNRTETILLSFSEKPQKLGNIFDNPELLEFPNE